MQELGAPLGLCCSSEANISIKIELRCDKCVPFFVKRTSAVIHYRPSMLITHQTKRDQSLIFWAGLVIWLHHSLPWGMLALLDHVKQEECFALQTSALRQSLHSGILDEKMFLSRLKYLKLLAFVVSSLHLACVKQSSCQPVNKACLQRC